MSTSSVAQYYQDDHDRLDELFIRYQQQKSSDPHAAAAILSEFREGLLRHIAWEEEILFPLFEQKTGMVNHGPTAVMRAEHDQIKQHLAIITGDARRKDAVTEDERNFLILLALHNQKEEKILYPAIDRAINDRERNGVFLAMDAEKG